MNPQRLSPDSWQYRALNQITPGLNHFSDALIELAEQGHPVMAGSADLQYSNGLNKFVKAFPERYVQFGISEQNMVTAAAGLATTGQIPFVATFASFLGLLCCGRGLQQAASAAGGPPHRHLARLLRHLPSRHGRHRDHAFHRGADGDLASRRPTAGQRDQGIDPLARADLLPHRAGS